MDLFIIRSTSRLITTGTLNFLQADLRFQVTLVILQRNSHGPAVVLTVSQFQVESGTTSSPGFWFLLGF